MAGEVLKDQTNEIPIEDLYLPENHVTDARNREGSGQLKTIREIEIEHIIATLRACNGKISGPGGAAEILDLPYSTLTSRIKKYGIKKEMLYNS